MQILDYILAANTNSTWIFFKGIFQKMYFPPTGWTKGGAFPPVVQPVGGK
jgi:hypothetical protein